MKRAAMGAMLLGTVAAGAWGPMAHAAQGGGRRCTGEPLPVVVEESPEGVRLRIRIGEHVDPGSVEVALDGARASVAAREVATGRRLCSGDLWLRVGVVEEKPVADYEDGWLTITLSRAPEGDGAK